MMNRSSLHTAAHTAAMQAPKGLPAVYLVAIVSGACTLLLIGLAFVALWYCKLRKKQIPLEWSHDSDSPPHMVSSGSLAISQSTPNLAEEARKSGSSFPFKKNLFKSAFRQSTLPTVPQRHLTFQRQLSHKLDLSNIEFTVQRVKHKEQPTLGSIKPELYKQPSTDSVKSEHMPCGKFYFSLKYNYDLEGLVINVIKAEDLPAKDFSGTSDPYVKMYLLPNRKHKFQTKVHRKTLNPEFYETFIINVPYVELTGRTLQFSVYDFDRFSRHDLIGVVLVRDLLGDKDLTKETFYVRDILSAHQEKVDLGELMLSLCYLPTAGRLTVTIVKARNLKAMDITGYSDPYVKVSLMCQGKRIKKKKTSVKKNTLNPVYNEAIVFDVPQENVEEVGLIVKVIDYDRIGNNEIIGCCAVGPVYCGPGRDHWFEMLENPRKPIAQWYPLIETIPGAANLPDTPNGKTKMRLLSETSEASSMA